LTPKEIKGKYGLDINEPVGAKCVEMSDKDIGEIERRIREYPLSPEECFLAKENPVKNLITALKKDKDYYEVWKANIAMAFKDEYTEQSYNVDNARLEGFLTEIDIHELSNNAAERFLKQLIS
jgi:hypothetical protein